MEKWKAASLGITSLAAANLTALAGVFFLHLSRPTALRVLLVFRVSAVALLPLISVEFRLRRMQGEEYGPAVFNAVLVMLMFCVWFVVAAATF
jgi:hypothetical protein